MSELLYFNIYGGSERNIDIDAIFGGAELTDDQQDIISLAATISDEQDNGDEQTEQNEQDEQDQQNTQNEQDDGDQQKSIFIEEACDSSSDSDSSSDDDNPIEIIGGKKKHKDVDATLSQLEETTKELKVTTHHLEETIDDMKRTAENIDESAHDIILTANRVWGESKDILSTIDNVEDTHNNIIERVNVLESKIGDEPNSGIIGGDEPLTRSGPDNVKITCDSLTMTGGSIYITEIEDDIPVKKNKVHFKIPPEVICNDYVSALIDEISKLGLGL
jgi:hypothetical protein